MAGRVLLTFEQKYAVLLKCKSLNVKGGLEGVKQVQDWVVSKIQLIKPPAYQTIKRILDDEDSTTPYAISHEKSRKKAYFTRNDAIDQQL